MKRFVITTIAVACAQLCFAAAITWGSGVPTASVPPISAGDDITQYIAYLCIGGQDDAMQTFQQISSGMEWSAPTIGEGNSAMVKNLTPIGTIPAGDSTIFSDAIHAGTTYEFYLVLFDATRGYVAVSSVISGIPFDENGAAEPSEIVWTDGASLVATSGGWQKIVPEPTALALLALGVAGVALRRKVSA